MPSRDCPCKSLIVAAAKLNAGKATLFRDKEPCRLAAISPSTLRRAWRITL